MVSSFHASLAFMLGAGGLLLLAQGLANAAWETHFYGSQSATTLSLVFGSLTILGIASFTLISAAGYMVRASWSRWGMVGASLFLVLSVPFPLNWMVLLAMIAVATEGRRPNPDDI